MKKVVAILFALLAVQSYGVYGRSQADRIVFSCELDVGPLCYSWKPNGLARLIGTDGAANLESRLEQLKEAWDEQFIERIQRHTEKKSELQKALDGMHQKATKKLDQAAEKVKGFLDALEKP